MKQFIHFVIFFLMKIQNCQEIDENCKKILSEHVLPLECCQYPFHSTENSSAEVRYEKSNSLKSCEFTDCVGDELQLFTDGKVDFKKMAEYFMIGLDFLKIPKGNWPEVAE